MIVQTLGFCHMVGGTEKFFRLIELKKAAIAQMQDGSPVWFGCDVGKYSCGENGVMDLDLYQTEELLGTTYHLTKAERLDYHESLMHHS